MADVFLCMFRTRRVSAWTLCGIIASIRCGTCARIRRITGVLARGSVCSESCLRVFLYRYLFMSEDSGRWGISPSLEVTLGRGNLLSSLGAFLHFSIHAKVNVDAMRSCSHPHSRLKPATYVSVFRTDVTLLCSRLSTTHITCTFSSSFVIRAKSFFVKPSHPTSLTSASALRRLLSLLLKPHDAAKHAMQDTHSALLACSLNAGAVPDFCSRSAAHNAAPQVFVYAAKIPRMGTISSRVDATPKLNASHQQLSDNLVQGGLNRYLV